MYQAHPKTHIWKLVDVEGQNPKNVNFKYDITTKKIIQEINIL